MADTPAGGAAPHPDHHAPTMARNSRYGLALFAVYLALYAGFVALSAFAPQRMGRPFLGGVNLAVVYGFGLIAAALLLALIYMFLCRPAAVGDVDPGVDVGTFAGSETFAETERLVDAELRDEARGERQGGQQGDRTGGDRTGGGR